MRVLKFGIVLLSVSLFVFACTQSGNTNTANTNMANGNSTNKAGNAETTAQPTAAAADELAAGKKIYTEKCARCHKDDGTGGKTEIDGTMIDAKNLTTEKMKNHPDSEYIEAIEKGFPDDGMPAFKGKLTDQEIKDVIKYVRTAFQGK